VQSLTHYWRIGKIDDDQNAELEDMMESDPNLNKLFLREEARLRELAERRRFEDGWNALRAQQER
jgi:hypothetical protein